MKKKQQQPIGSIALVDRQFASRLTGKYGWLVNRSVHRAGFVYLMPSRRTSDGRGARDLHIRFQYNYANYYLKLLQTFQLETAAITAKAAASREAGPGRQAEQVTGTAQPAGITARAEMAAAVKVRTRAKLEMAELQQVVRTVKTETARLESLRRAVRPKTAQDSRVHRDFLSSPLANRRTTRPVSEEAMKTAQTSLTGTAQVEVQRTISMQGRLLQTTERTIRISYERLSRLQTLLHPVRPLGQMNGGEGTSLGGVFKREGKRSAASERRFDKPSAANADQRRIAGRSATPIDGGAVVRGPRTTPSRQWLGALVYRDLRMAAWPRGNEAGDGTAALGLTARRASDSVHTAQRQPRAATLSPAAVRPSEAVRLTPGRLLLSGTTALTQVTVRRSAGSSTIRPPESQSEAYGVRANSQGIERVSGQSLAASGYLGTGGVTASRAHDETTVTGAAVNHRALRTGLRSAGRLPVRITQSSVLAEAVQARLQNSPLSAVIRIIALPHRSRDTGGPVYGATLADRPKVTRDFRRQSAVLIHSISSATGGLERNSDRQAPAPSEGEADSRRTNRSSGVDGRITTNDKQRQAANSSNGTLADDARRRPLPGEPAGPTDAHQRFVPDRQQDLSASIVAKASSMRISGSVRIRDWLMRTVVGTTSAPRLRGYASSPASQEHAKPLTGGRRLLQRLQQDRAGRPAHERSQPTLPGQAMPERALQHKSASAAYIGARGSLRVTHRRSVRMEARQPDSQLESGRGATSSRQAERSSEAARRLPAPVRASATPSLGSGTARPESITASGQSNGAIGAASASNQASSMGMTGGSRAGDQNVLASRSNGGSRRVSSATPFGRSMSGRDFLSSDASLFGWSADHSVAERGVTWQGHPLLLRFSLAERLIHKQTSPADGRLGHNLGLMSRGTTVRRVNDRSDSQGGTARTGVSAQSASTEVEQPRGRVAAARENRASASLASVRPATVIPRSGNSPGTPLGGRRLTAALALVAARLGKWQAPRTTRIPGQAGAVERMTRNSVQTADGSQPGAHVTARRTALPVTARTVVSHSYNGSSEDNAAGAALALERAIQAQGSTASTSVQPQQRAAASDIVRRPLPPRPALQAMLRGLAMPARRSPGAEPLTARRSAAQPVAPPLSVRRTSAQPDLAPLSARGTGAQPVAAPLSVRRTSVHPDLAPLSTRGTGAQPVAPPLSVRRTSVHPELAPLSARGTGAQPVAAPLSVRRTAAQSGLAPHSARGIGAQPAAAPLSVRRTAAQPDLAPHSARGTGAQPVAAPLSVRRTSAQPGSVSLTARRAATQTQSGRTLPRLTPWNRSVVQQLASAPLGVAEREIAQRQAALVPLQVGAGRSLARAAQMAPMARGTSMVKSASQLPALLYKEEPVDSQTTRPASTRPAERRPRVAARAVPLEFAVRSRAAADEQAEQDRAIRKSLSRLEGEMKELRSQPSAPVADVRTMTDQMYREITRRMRFEQQRRGL